MKDFTVITLIWTTHIVWLLILYATTSIGLGALKAVGLLPSYDEYKQLVSKTEQLEKKLEIATKALEYYAQCKHLNLDILAMLLDKHKNEFADFEVYEDGEHAREALKEMEGVK